MQEIMVAALAFGLMSAGIVWKQSRAKHCPVHSRPIGRLAMFVALGCGIASLALAGLGWALRSG